MESEWTIQQLDDKNNRKTTYSVSPIYVKNGKTVTELFRLSPVTVFLLGFIPPMIGAFAAVIAALIFHSEQISNYNWQCGRARLPSLSRIINLPLERLIWQFLVLIQTPARIIELFTGFCRYGRLMNMNYQHKRFYELARYTYFYAGIAELFFMIALSLLGERENIPYDVFAICEYVGVFLNIAYHGCAFYDIRYKVIFSVRFFET
ncbi:hypothetical protein DINM_021140 [Dirofilaria immitis]|nr:hypothetical protein [Dirofilaria immitis]